MCKNKRVSSEANAFFGVRGKNHYITWARDVLHDCLCVTGFRVSPLRLPCSLFLQILNADTKKKRKKRNHYGLFVTGGLNRYFRCSCSVAISAVYINRTPPHAFHPFPLHRLPLALWNFPPTDGGSWKAKSLNIQIAYQASAFISCKFCIRVIALMFFKPRPGFRISGIQCEKRGISWKITYHMNSPKTGLGFVLDLMVMDATAVVIQ